MRHERCVSDCPKNSKEGLYTETVLPDGMESKSGKMIEIFACWECRFALNVSVSGSSVFCYKLQKKISTEYPNPKISEECPLNTKDDIFEVAFDEGYVEGRRNGFEEGCDYVCENPMDFFDPTDLRRED